MLSGTYIASSLLEAQRIIGKASEQLYNLNIRVADDELGAAMVALEDARDALQRRPPRKLVEAHEVDAWVRGTYAVA